MTKTLTNNVNCSLCKGQMHYIYKCPEFIKMTIRQRQDFVKKTSLCKNCLRTHHGKCSFSHCRKCSKFHNTLLHEEFAKSETTSNRNKKNDATDNIAETKNESA